MTPNAAILLAGGSSRRMQGHTTDKTLLPLAGKPLFLHCLDTFLSSGLVGHIVIVHRDSTHKEILEPLLPQSKSVKYSFTQGGEERMYSVYNGLDFLRNDPSGIVFIHDAARPFISVPLLLSLAHAAQQHGAACPGTRVADTLKRATPEIPATLKPIRRDNLWALQTPQTFHYPTILKAYETAMADHIPLTDDTSALSHIGRKVHLIENPAPNPKLTTPADLPLLEFLLSRIKSGNTSQG